MNPEQFIEYQKTLADALSRMPEIAQFAGANSIDSIINAFTTNDWSGVRSLSGKPFTRQQQEEAVRQAERALAPAYRAQEAYDTSVVEDSLAAEQEALAEFQKGEEEAFGDEKKALDQNAANQGILFTGSRFQKLNDLRNTYQDRERLRRGMASDAIRSKAREFQYKYGDEGARGLRDYYKIPEARTFDANVAGGKVTPGSGLSSIYSTKDFNFQGTAPVAQKAATQTRAASLLANRANKLTTTGYQNQF